MNPAVTVRDTLLERGIRTIMEGEMPVFMKFDGVDGEFSDADRFDFSQLTTEPTAPQAEEQKAPSISEITVTKVTDSTSPLLGEVNHSEFSIVKLSDVASPKTPSPDDLAVDPNNPNLTAVQTDDGLLLPAVRMDDGEASIKDGSSNTVFFSERYGSRDDEYVLTGIQHGADDSQTSHLGGANMLFGDGSVRTTDTSAVAPLHDFDWPSSPSDTHDALVLVTDADPEGAIAGVIIAATSDNNRIDDGADYSGSHLLYQDVIIPTLDAGTVFRPSDAYWY